MTDQYKENVDGYYDGNLGPILKKQKNNNNSSSIEIDFTGEELEQIAYICKRDNVTFSELIDKALQNLLDNYKGKDNG
jgi:hypothetical protein